MYVNMSKQTAKKCLTYTCKYLRTSGSGCTVKKISSSPQPHFQVDSHQALLPSPNSCSTLSLSLPHPTLAASSPPPSLIQLLQHPLPLPSSSNSCSILSPSLPHPTPAAPSPSLTQLSCSTHSLPHPTLLQHPLPLPPSPNSCSILSLPHPTPAAPSSSLPHPTPAAPSPSLTQLLQHPVPL